MTIEHYIFKKQLNKMIITGRGRRTKKSWNGQPNSVAYKGNVSQGNFMNIY